MKYLLNLRNKKCYIVYHSSKVCGEKHTSYLKHDPLCNKKRYDCSILILDIFIETIHNMLEQLMFLLIIRWTDYVMLYASLNMY